MEVVHATGRLARELRGVEIGNLVVVGVEDIQDVECDLEVPEVSSRPAIESER
jgi:hypothetical protein